MTNNPVNIIQMLRGSTPEAQQRLLELKDRIGSNPLTSWYPSAGNDYRDLIELSAPKADTSVIRELPELFVHTDCIPAWLNLGPVPFEDKRTTVRILEKHELHIHPRFRVRFQINPEYASFSETAPRRPTIYLMDVLVESNRYGFIRKPVLYFLFENINFLQEVLLQHKVYISHIVKVREGMGFGGNNRCISLAYGFLANMNTKYLLADTEVHLDDQLFCKLSEKRPALNYALTPVAHIPRWSYWDVNVFSIQKQLCALTLEQFYEHLGCIREKHGHFIIAG
jgi:hypothetical protein